MSKLYQHLKVKRIDQALVTNFEVLNKSHKNDQN
jgi:hypothetical protein